MSYDYLILALMMLLFCVFSIVFTAKVIFTLMNAVRPPEMDEIKPIRVFEKREKPQMSHAKSEEEAKMEKIMRNLDNFDGTGLGQEEVE